MELRRCLASQRQRIQPKRKSEEDRWRLKKGGDHSSLGIFLGAEIALLLRSLTSCRWGATECKNTPWQAPDALPGSLCVSFSLALFDFNLHAFGLRLLRFGQVET